MWVVSMRLYCRDASSHMQHDLCESPRDFDLRLKFDLGISSLTCICFDVALRDKQCYQNYLSSFGINSYFPRTIFEKYYFELDDL